MASNTRPPQNTLLYSSILMAISIALGVSGTLLIQSWDSKAKRKPVTPRKELLSNLTTTLRIEQEPSMGSDQAPLTIVEFSDFECIYCQRFHAEILPKLRKDYIQTGLVRFIHKDLPLPYHQHSRSAAAAARCAGKQNKYWMLYTALFDQQNCLSCKGALGIAEEQGFNIKKIAECMQNKHTERVINANLSEASLHDISATPSFVIGPTLNNGEHNGEIIQGVMPWPQFKKMIDQKLKTLR